MPNVRDPDNDPFTVKVAYMLKGASSSFPSFITYKDDLREFRFNPMDVKDVGKYSFLIELTDQHKYPKKRTQLFDIEVTKYDPKMLSQLKARQAKRIQYISFKVDNVTESG